MSSFAELQSKFPEVVETLGHARTAGRLAHSFLVISESAGVRRKFATVLAQIAGCPDPDEHGMPDLTCPVCRALERETYQDMHQLSPVGKMYQIRVGEMNNPEPNTVRSFMSGLYLSASGSSRKFGIIQEADRMNREAQNALLKTLEEPPRDTTLILCTANPGALLATTRSRCQQINLPDREGIFEFDGLHELTEALHDITFRGINDMLKAEQAAAAMISIAEKLADSADAEVGDRFDAAFKAAENAGDNAMRKRLESRRADEVSGAFMRCRSRYLGVIEAYCSQVFMLSRGVPPELLPHPELLATLGSVPQVTARRGDTVLAQAENLCQTLRYNVNLELALRTFAMQMTLLPDSAEHL